MEIKIEEDVRIEQKLPKADQYGIEAYKLLVKAGQSFLVPEGLEAAKVINRLRLIAKKKNPERVFVRRNTEEGIRIWRVEDEPTAANDEL